jgi:hypothetical protein
VISGFRSPDTQRALFLRNLPSAAAIAAGTADAAVDLAMHWVAPPGFSKHQTGYALDLAAPGGTQNQFVGSAGERWLSAGNFANARRHGFVPSYPAGATAMGAFAEPWEYVYAGVDALGPSTPIGYVDLVAPDDGTVTVAGWTFDRSAPSEAIDVHVYVGGPAGSPEATGFPTGPARLRRDDVAAVHPDAGAHHGFRITLPTDDRTGPTPVCSYAIDLAPGTNRLLACRTVDLPDRSPVGHLDRVQRLPDGTVAVEGWTFDPSDPLAPVDVHVYVGGPAGTPGAQAYNTGPARARRDDVAVVHPRAGASHGFAVVVGAPAPGTSPTVCVHLIDRPPGRDRLLGCRGI